jgi:sarcosine oxidase
VATAIVVGAGVFGTSLARHLAGSGWEVSLVEQYQPGHVRAASGGESRLIRFAHGADAWYTRSAYRARGLWRQLEQETGTNLLVESGLLWLARTEDGWEAESERTLREAGVRTQRLAPDQAGRCFPSFEGAGIEFALLEPEAGVLRAAAATRALAHSAVQRGVRLLAGVARPAGAAVELEGRRLEADHVVWACGAWLASLFADLVSLRVTKQDVYFFGAPAPWSTPPVPAFVEYDAAFYGLGDLDGHGVKIAPDLEGPPFDPDIGERVASPEGERSTRAYLTERFPGLAGAPLVLTRTCQYSLTGDTNFLVARHPEHEKVWLLGGGSGHGFKHGPALAEYVSRLMTGDEAPNDRFALGARDRRTSLRTAGTAVA